MSLLEKPESATFVDGCADWCSAIVLDGEHPGRNNTIASMVAENVT